MKGHATDLGKDNASKGDEQEIRQEEFGPWQKYAGQVYEVLDTSAMYDVGRGREDGHAWRYCPRLDEAGKAPSAQRKGQMSKENQKGNSGM